MNRIIPLFLILLAACKQTLPTVPAELIQMKEMEIILQDMHMTDAVAESKAQMGMNEKLLTEEYYEQIFKSHKTTREHFLKSYKFYETHPQLLDQMYNEILDGLSKREEAVSKKQ